MPVSVSELLADDAIGRSVRRRFRGWAPCTLCTAGRGVTWRFSAKGRQLGNMRGHKPDKEEVRLKGHTGYQEHVVSVRVRTRSEVRGPRSSFRADGGTIAHMLELMSGVSWFSRPCPPFLVSV